MREVLEGDPIMRKQKSVKRVVVMYLLSCDMYGMLDKRTMYEDINQHDHHHHHHDDHLATKGGELIMFEGEVDG